MLLAIVKDNQNALRVGIHLRSLFLQKALADRDRPTNGEKMRVQRMVAGIALGCLMALGPAQVSRAGLQIDLVYIENPGQPAKLVQGGGQLREIMQVAAENWMRIFKGGSGNWKLTIEYGWNVLRDENLFAQEYMVSERGNNPSRIDHSCILSIPLL